MICLDFDLVGCRIDLLGKADQRLMVFDIGQEDDELIAAEAPDAVCLAENDGK